MNNQYWINKEFDVITNEVISEFHTFNFNVEKYNIYLKVFNTIFDKKVEVEKEVDEDVLKYLVEENEKEINYTQEEIDESIGDDKYEEQDKSIELKSQKNKKHKLIQKLYKKIASKTHPDVGGDEGEFSKLVDWYDKNDLVSLLITYKKLFNTDDIHLTNDDINLLKSFSKLIQQQIKNLKTTIAYMLFDDDISNVEKFMTIEKLSQLLNVKIDDIVNKVVDGNKQLQELKKNG